MSTITHTTDQNKAVNFGQGLAIVRDHSAHIDLLTRLSIDDAASLYDDGIKSIDLATKGAANVCLTVRKLAESGYHEHVLGLAQRAYDSYRDNGEESAIWNRVRQAINLWGKALPAPVQLKTDRVTLVVSWVPYVAKVSALPVDSAKDAVLKLNKSELASVLADADVLALVDENSIAGKLNSQLDERVEKHAGDLRNKIGKMEVQHEQTLQGHDTRFNKAMDENKTLAAQVESLKHDLNEARNRYEAAEKHLKPADLKKLGLIGK